MSRRDEQRERLQEVCRSLLRAIGERPDRDGLRETPRRFADWWLEFVEFDAGNRDTTFEVVQADQMVVVSGIKVWSICEHHLLPFWCELSMAYVTKERVLGLSKFGRIAQGCAHRLQIQERLVQDIADALQERVRTEDVAVLGRGEHLCMTMRGARTPAILTTSVMRGVFLNDASARAEFLRLSSNG